MPHQFLSLSFFFFFHKTLFWVQKGLTKDNFLCIVKKKTHFKLLFYLFGFIIIFYHRKYFYPSCKKTTFILLKYFFYNKSIYSKHLNRELYSSCWVMDIHFDAKKTWNQVQLSNTYDPFNLNFGKINFRIFFLQKIDKNYLHNVI